MRCAACSTFALLAACSLFPDTAPLVEGGSGAAAGAGSGGEAGAGGNGGCGDTKLDPDNCGVCGFVCPPVPNGTRACTDGVCGLSACNTGFEPSAGQCIPMRPLLDSTSNADSGIGPVAALDFAHTVGSFGDPTILLVGVTISSPAGETVTSVKYGSTPLSLVDASTNPGNVRVELWSLPAPAAGTALVGLTLSASTRLVAGAASFHRVHATTPLGTVASSTAAGASASLVLPSVQKAELVLGFMGHTHKSTTATAAAGQKDLWNAATAAGSDATNVRGAAGTLEPPDSGDPSLSWQLSESRAWTLLAVPLRPE